MSLEQIFMDAPKALALILTKNLSLLALIKSCADLFSILSDLSLDHQDLHDFISNLKLSHDYLNGRCTTGSNCEDIANIILVTCSHSLNQCFFRLQDNEFYSCMQCHSAHKALDVTRHALSHLSKSPP